MSSPTENPISRAFDTSFAEGTQKKRKQGLVITNLIRKIAGVKACEKRQASWHQYA